MFSLGLEPGTGLGATHVYEVYLLKYSSKSVDAILCNNKQC